MSSLNVVMPAGVNDPQQPSGGHHYDRRICDELRELGWSVREHLIPDDGLDGPEGLGRLGGALAAVPNGELTIIDGLLACGSPGAVLPHSARLRLVALVHLPLGLEQTGARTAERAVLTGCAAVVTTSAWTRTWLLEHYPLDPERVHVCHPGVDPVAPAVARPDGARLVVVGRVMRAKGHDVLASALAGLADLHWRCACIGSLDTDPAFVAAFRRQLDHTAIADRVLVRGCLPAVQARRSYAAADLLLLPSRLETYGMVVTEALARGLPVVATAVGGVPEALGHAPDGRRPGLLVRPGDPAALGSVIRSWLSDDDLRTRLRDAALARRTGLAGWPEAAERVGEVLRLAVPRQLDRTTG